MDDFREHLQPGYRVVIWFNEGDDVLILGNRESYVYQGYQVIGTETFWIVDVVRGTGKKTKTTRIALNAANIGKHTIISE